MPSTPKRGRKPIEIDLNQVEELAGRGLTEEQIADALGIHQSTLSARKKQFSEFSEAIKKGKAKGIAHVTNKLFDQIESGSVAATIFFLKAKAGWKETQVFETPDLANKDPVDSTDEEILAEIRARRAARKGT